MKKESFPILEFDEARNAILEPTLIEPMDVPEHCVVCFFADVIQWIVEEQHAKIIANSVSEMGQHPLYEMSYKGKRLAFFHPGIGAPLAAALLEEAVARGCRKFMACGGCGVLDKEIAVGHLLLPVGMRALRTIIYHLRERSKLIRGQSRRLNPC